MITDFLKTDIPINDLTVALKVLRQFKRCESANEWVLIPFAAWAKFEQLEEFLSYLVESVPLSPDTIRYMETKDA